MPLIPQSYKKVIEMSEKVQEVQIIKEKKPRKKKGWKGRAAERKTDKRVKLTDDLIDKICSYVKLGQPLERAAISSGISPRELARMLARTTEKPQWGNEYWKRCHKLKKKIQEAAAKLEEFHLSNITKQSLVNAELSKWLLKKRFRKEWGDEPTATNIQLQNNTLVQQKDPTEIGWVSYLTADEQAEYLRMKRLAKERMEEAKKLQGNTTSTLQIEHKQEEDELIDID